MTVLDRLVGEVLAGVNVLCPLTAADDVVAPFDARSDTRCCPRRQALISLVQTPYSARGIGGKLLNINRGC
jgi:hypothetical protein